MFLRKIFFITIPTIIVFLFVLEISLRIGGYLYTRYRNPEIYAKTELSKRDTFNILCLGDSFTFGAGTTPENSYPRQLERLLRENVSKDINVIDGGRGGNTSSLLLKNLQEDIYKYHPDVVIIMIGINNHWNLEDSSFFLLNKDYLSFVERLGRLLGHLRIYKLAKIVWVNFKHKIYDNNKFDHNKIIPRLTYHPVREEMLLAQGKFDLALEELEEVAMRNKDYYKVHLLLAYIYCAKGYFKLAKAEMWQAVRSIDVWNEGLLYNIIMQINQFDDAIVNRQSELINLKEYFQNKYLGDEKRRLVKIIDANLHILKDHKILHRALEYDLGEIIRLIKKNSSTVILQTYPGWLHNSVIRKVSNIYNIPLVDN